ncbi:uncharacterized protein ATC70_004176 [Mucor velutinosus]|uniref:Uncharacterized protein n=1 Tax=Mucor velutinosus TaxID=708070 RepID=A0AAN7HWS8_9FUNG|nr:hypothetical protein ATC70_004176 [Mucor velutinosus]
MVNFHCPNVSSATHDPYHLLQQLKPPRQNDALHMPSSQAAHCAAYHCNDKTTPIRIVVSTSIQKQAILLSLLPIIQSNV